MDAFKDVKYRQLEKPYEPKGTHPLKVAIVLLSVTCCGLLAFGIYTYIHCRHNFTEVQEGGVQIGFLPEIVEDNGYPEQDALVENVSPMLSDKKTTINMFVLKAHETSPVLESDVQFTTDKWDELASTEQETVGWMKSTVGYRHGGWLNRNAMKGMINTDSLEITRELLMTRLREVIYNLRTGKEDRLSMQVSLLFLQQALRRLNRQQAGYVEATPSGTVSTLDTPRVRSMMAKLTLSPHELDTFDFNFRSKTDFRCVRMRFQNDYYSPHPAICMQDDHTGETPLEVARTWLKPTMEDFMSILMSDDELQVVDLGSNLGIYSLAAASLDRPVLAVETDDRNIIQFSKSVNFNKFEKLVTLVTNSISDHYKLEQLIHSKEDHGDTQTVEITEYMLRNDVIRAEDVSRTVTLDDLVPAVTSKKAILKINLKGDEVDVFKGASSFFAAVDVRYVIMPWTYASEPNGGKFIADFLFNRSYLPFRAWNGDSMTTEELFKDLPVIYWIKHTVVKRRRPM